ncbi:MAG: leucyl aminopeptidase family protein [Bdellovibrionales bacterium]|nr:leucyl aminopeptidase family protein [Bdellovibrionales bacterium]
MNNCLTLNKSWISTFRWEQMPRGTEQGHQGHIFILGQEDGNQIQKLITKFALHWQKEELSKSSRELIYFQGSQGPVWILRPRVKLSSGPQGDGSFSKESSYGVTRDLCGAVVGQLRAHHLKRVLVEIIGVDAGMIRGTLIGFELGAYQFRGHFEGKPVLNLDMYIKTTQSPWSYEQTRAQIRACEAEAQAVNQARHWVNLPPNILSPLGMVKAAKSLKWSKASKLNVWNLARLEKEKMGLHIAVGQGASTAPCLLHIEYRPRQGTKSAPIAFVGKGVTFDTGGLDIKPSAGMRLMKKDMGGAAAVLALAQWVSASGYSRPCDFYLCLAENSVDAKAFRPSDLIRSRSGQLVEIDNTDAEGRLVLADGLDVAVTQKETPEIVIDVATLTGAIKVALGAEVAGLFSNDEQLGNDLFMAGLRAGDYNWKMPLVDRYFSSLHSHFSDFKNSADGFGGAITAALFLQKFVKKIKWAHLDIYAWADKSHGAMSQAGGNGQAVQCLIEFLKSRV